MLVNCTLTTLIFSCLHRTISKVDNCITKLGSPNFLTMGGTLPIHSKSKSNALLHIVLNIWN